MSADADTDRLKAVLYCRLSKEDEAAGPGGESESIQNQRALLAAYAEEQGFAVTAVYCDEDYSGADRDRPDFRRMLAAARRREFDVLLVKTQSRFTRDMELVERYIHRDFPLWGIRFIAVVDHVDTGVRGGKKARQINGLINEWYLEDLSENIRAVLDYKRRNGQFIGSFPLYGYRRDPADRHRLLPDPEAAEVVRAVFRRYTAGESAQHIAATLNEAGVPNPTAYKRLKGLAYQNGGGDTDGRWTRSAVGRILRERQYTGVLLQGKRRKPSYKSKLLLAVPREDWIEVPGAFEPIVEEAVFRAAERLLNSRVRSDGTGHRHLLAGKVRCMDCGAPLAKVSDTYKGHTRSYLRCGRCAAHSVRLDWLEEEIVGRLRALLSRYFSPKDAPSPARDQAAHLTALRRERQSLLDEIARRIKAQRALYLDKAEGLLSAEQFRELNEGYREEREQLETRLARLEERLEDAAAAPPPREAAPPWMEAPFPRELIDAFIDSIEVGGRDAASGEQPLQIHWRL